MSLLPKICPRSKNLYSPEKISISRVSALLKFQKIRTLLNKKAEDIELTRRNRPFLTYLEIIISDERFGLVKITEFKESEKLFRAFSTGSVIGKEGDLRRGLPENKPHEGKVYFGISPDIPIEFLERKIHGSDKVGEYVIRRNFSCLDLRMSEEELYYISSKYLERFDPIFTEVRDKLGKVMFLQEIKVFKTLLYLNAPEDSLIRLLKKLFQYKTITWQTWVEIKKFTTISMTELINTVNAHFKNIIVGDIRYPDAIARFKDKIIDDKKYPTVIGIIRQNTDKIAENYNRRPSKISTKAHEELGTVESYKLHNIIYNCYPELVIRSDFLINFINPVPKKVLRKVDAVEKYGTHKQPYSTASHLTKEPYTMMDIPVDREGNVIEEKDVPLPQGPVPDPHTSFFNKMGNYSSVFKKTFFG